jgi:hypothetical protein
LAQQEALDFAGRSLWQLGNEVDPARIFVRGKAALAEFTELGGKRDASGLSVFEDDEGLWLDQTFLIKATNDGRSEASASTTPRITVGLLFGSNSMGRKLPGKLLADMNRFLH